MAARRPAGVLDPADLTLGSYPRFSGRDTYIKSLCLINTQHKEDDRQRSAVPSPQNVRNVCHELSSSPKPRAVSHELLSSGTQSRGCQPAHLHSFTKQPAPSNWQFIDSSPSQPATLGCHNSMPGHLHSNSFCCAHCIPIKPQQPHVPLTRPSHQDKSSTQGLVSEKPRA